jgi:cell fate regulator YaaT (PSP1 superfamily)
MDYTKYDKPEVGRGVTFGVNEVGEPCAKEARGCFRLHEEPWLEEYPDNFPTDIFEVRFKNTRRSFYQNVNNLQLEVGDIVAVEASPGHDIGIISLTGDMVARQMKRIGFNPHNGEFKKIYRKARPYDIEKWQEAIALEHETMIRSRQIAADMGLDMKIGDVEYQGDKIKAIFYYIADGRVDFRELIKVFAEQFHIRIEMKQIGARQEAGRIGGIGACGRELCCASWVSSFSSVTTGAARVQDLSLNPLKLAGPCSKLKCCLMYEYDVYADARRSMPRLREPLQAIDGEYFLVKSDILAHTMTFSTSKDSMSNLVTIPVSRVREILSINRNGGKVESILGEELEQQMEEPTFRTEEDSITRFDKSKKRKKRKGRNNNGHQNGQGEQSNKPQGDAQQKEQDAQPQPHKREEQKGQEQSAQGQEREQGGERHHGQRNHFHRNRGNQGGNRNNKNRQNNQNKPKQE